MKFGYFFLGVRQHELAANAQVEIRPMEGEHALAAGAKIVITVPLDTALAAQTLQAIAAHSLQSAQTLLPESALTLWAQTWSTAGFRQPTLPEDAGANWANI